MGKFGFDLIFDLGGQGQSLHKTIGTLTKLFCTFDPNLVILAWTGVELSCRQASDWYTESHTRTHTHTKMQATTIPKGQNWPRVKTGQVDSTPTSQITSVISPYKFMSKVKPIGHIWGPEFNWYVCFFALWQSYHFGLGIANSMVKVKTKIHQNLIR